MKLLNETPIPHTKHSIKWQTILIIGLAITTVAFGIKAFYPTNKDLELSDTRALLKNTTDEMVKGNAELILTKTLYDSMSKQYYGTLDEIKTRTLTQDQQSCDILNLRSDNAQLKSQNETLGRELNDATIQLSNAKLNLQNIRNVLDVNNIWIQDISIPQ